MDSVGRTQNIVVMVVVIIIFVLVVSGVIINDKYTNRAKRATNILDGARHSTASSFVVLNNLVPFDGDRFLKCMEWAKLICESDKSIANNYKDSYDIMPLVIVELAMFRYNAEMGIGK